MDRTLAQGLLDTGPDATVDEIEKAYWAKCNELESRIRIAPTAALKQVYREALEKLEEARDVLIDYAVSLEQAGGAAAPAEPPAPQAPPPPPAPAPPPVAPGSAPTKVHRPAAAPPSAGKEEGGRVVRRREEEGGAISDVEAAVGFFEGRVLLDRYEVRRRIGLGPHGAVYAGYDRKQGREVAIKVVLPRLLEDASVREAFLKDAKVASYLSHPGIAHVFEIHEEGATDRVEFLITELLKGESLASIYKRRGRSRATFELFDVVRVGASLCDSLHYAHQYAVHGAVKPDNVFLEPDGTVKLTDFGMGRLLSATGGAGEASPYLAPEQIEGGNVTHRADQYAVAAVLYEMLTGEVHRPGAESAAVLRPDVPADIAQAIDRALQPSPEERFPDQQEFGKVFVARLAGGRRGVPLRWAAAAVGVLALLLGSWLLIGGGEPDATRSARVDERQEAERRAREMASEAAREKTAEAQADAVRTAAQERLEIARRATATYEENEKYKRERLEATRQAEREEEARARQEALSAPATRAAAEVARAEAEQRGLLERQATARFKSDAEKTATARLKQEADRVATARAEAEAARQATATAEAEAAKLATVRAGVDAVRTATARVVEVQRAATQRAEAEAQRTATALAKARLEKEREERERPRETREGFIGPLAATVVNLRFFEKGAGETVAEGRRRFGDEFPQATTRFVFFELALTHPAPGTRKTFNLHAICRRPNGSTFGEGDFSTVIEPNWSKSTHVYGWGFSEPGQWEPGRYRVEVSFEGTRIAAASFVIE